MNARIEICLNSKLKRVAGERARALGISFAEYVRQLIERDLRSRHVVISRADLFDPGSSDGSGVAKNKRAMLSEALASRRRRIDG